MKEQIYCESCLQTGIKTPATRHSINLEWSGYDLCEECAAHYDAESPVNQAVPQEE